MRKLALILALLAGCGGPDNELPPHAFEVGGVDFYAAPELTALTPARASLHLRLVLEAYGRSYEEARGWKIAYTTQPFDCGDTKAVWGCYTHPDDIIRLRVAIPDCPEFVPLAHEVWHALGNLREPDEGQQAVIRRADIAANRFVLKEFCGGSDQG